MLPKLRRPATVQGVSLVIGMGTAHMSIPVARRHHRTPWLQCEMSMLFARQGRNHKAVMAVQLTFTCQGKCLALNCGGWPPQEHKKSNLSLSIGRKLEIIRSEPAFKGFSSSSASPISCYCCKGCRPSLATLLQLGMNE